LIVLVLFLLYFLPEIFRGREPVHTHPDRDRSLTVIPLPVMDEDAGRSYSKRGIRISEGDAEKKAVLFVFDPNTLNEEGFIRLGLRSSTIKTILNYRNRGGRFYMADDLKKVYGLKESEFVRLQGYVQIADTIRKQPFFRRDSSYKGHTGRTVIIDINQADSAMWDALPGIGSVLSSRIIRYREKLGGFVDIAQIREVYGISDSLYTLIRPRLYSTGVPLRHISVNAEQESVLSAHPYIGRVLAKEIVAYRSAHGPFRDTSGLYLLMSKPAGQIQRIFSYLTWDRTQ
jgi:DNA uptake protein ComE-like DNA-binding protein